MKSVAQLLLERDTKLLSEGWETTSVSSFSVLWVCPDCYAPVLDKSVELHANWHDKLNGEF